MKITVIGFGNLGRAFVSGLLKSGKAKAEDITVCAKSEETLSLAKNTYGIGSTGDFNYSVNNADIVFLVLKPAVFLEIALKIPDGIPVVSFIAGVKIGDIRRITKTQTEIVRAMPNLAIEKCEGIIGHTPTENEYIIDIFKSLGLAYETDESGIDKLTAFSACGLGFAAYILNAYTEAGISLGLSPEICGEVTRRTFISAAEVSNFKHTITAVATKGGATEQGLRIMEEKRLNEIIGTAVFKAYDKMK